MFPTQTDLKNQQSGTHTAWDFSNIRLSRPPVLIMTKVVGQWHSISYHKLKTMKAVFKSIESDIGTVDFPPVPCSLRVL